MKKLLLIAAVSMAATSAFASKARVAALQSAAHLSDIQDVFARPDRAATLGEWATFEFGSTAGSTSNSEGGFVRKHGDNAWGLYLGHTADSVSLARSLAAAGSGSSTALTLGVTAQENPLYAFYGAKTSEMTWGAGFFYTNSDKKSTASKQNAMGLVGSMTMGALDAYFKFGLANTAQKDVTTSGVTTTHKLTASTTAELNVGYTMDTLYYYGDYKMGGVKGEIGSTTASNWDSSTIQLGLINSHKKDGVDFFYGASYTSQTVKEKQASLKSETTTLPVIVGIEADAANWLTFRASLTQSVLLGSTKVDTGLTGSTSGETDTTANNTVVAAGVGMKWNKFVVDGVVQNSGANGGAFGLDSAGFLGKVSMTYNF